MNIALIGSGGREHAICQKLIESSSSTKVYCIPGNAGTSLIAKNLNFNFLNFKKLYAAIKFYKIELVVIGPEVPLVNGMVDFLKKNKIKVFGPNKFAARLEGSKAFMKNICKEYKIPTAGFKICTNKKHVSNFLNNHKLPIVVKADGLAAGKGVTICKTKKEIEKVSKEIFQGKFKSSKKLVLEEFLTGEEASYFLIVDKNSYSFFGSAQDHKRVGEKETGPNTGGMGAYSPALIVTKELEKKIIKKIIEPTLKAIKDKKNSYTGFLYAGLMIKDNEPYLIEYNVRMGDPECQVILPRLNTDLAKIIEYAVNNQLKKIKINWKKEKCMTIVMCSKGYPGKHINEKPIGLGKLNLSKNSFIFHAGTKIKNNIIISNGGRVLNITERGNNFLKMRNNIIRNIKNINWRYGFFRKDIGWRVVNR
jgi:phosphoribosylamine--glycine ligase